MTPEEQARKDDYGYWDDLHYQRELPSAYKHAVDSVMKLQAARTKQDQEIEQLKETVKRLKFEMGYPEAKDGIEQLAAERDALRARVAALANAARSAEKVLLRRGEREAASWLNHALATLPAGKGELQ